MHEWKFPGVVGFTGNVAEIVVVAVCKRCGTIRTAGFSARDRETAIDLSGECEDEGEIQPGDVT